MRARRLDPTPAALADAAASLARGELVAFPTETVYGLGANALDPAACEAIFRAKRRPHTDPLIVHLARAEAALALAELSTRERAIAGRLATLWPGPLTLVLRARPEIPAIVRAGGDTVGLRVPAHPVAHALLEASALPIAAPSANRFGHVSPTTADHVLADLGEEPITVLDGGPCPVGIESTVVRLDDEGIVVLRRGLVSPAQLEATSGVAVTVRERHAATDEAQAAPGQLLTHYAPTRPTFLLATSERGDDDAPALPATGSAIVDFGGRARALAGAVTAYVELDADGDPRAAAARLFATLRDLESRPEVVRILLPDLRATADDDVRALFDRLYRAASGRRARLASP
jgi:tRNA threonylcarbamoyl adenosine modification protein (Sua5/YciO/YrdC/YwlC family)